MAFVVNIKITGAPAIYVWGVAGDSLLRSGNFDLVAKAVDLAKAQNIPVGVASVLTSLSPIFMLPFSHFFFKERLGWQPIAGTLLAMAGVVILFLS